MQKILLLCLIGLFSLFQFQMHFGRGGYIDNDKIKKQIYMQRQINVELEKRNKEMFVRAEGLKVVPDGLEARARFELNLIKPNEILVLLPDHL